MPARIKPVNTASFRRQDDSSNFSKSKRPLRLLGRGMIMHREAIFLFQPLSVSFAVRVWAAHEPPKQSLIGTASLYCLIVILSEAKNLHTPPFAKGAGGDLYRLQNISKKLAIPGAGCTPVRPGINFTFYHSAS